MAPKRGLFLAAGDGAQQGKRPRSESAAPGSSSVPEPPSSPKHFMAIVLVVLFLKRPKGRSQDTVPVSASLSQFGRMIGQMRDEIFRFISPIYRKLETLESKLERIDEQIEDLTVKVDNMKRPSPSLHNHEQFTQEANQQEGTSAEAEGLDTALLGKGQPENTSIRLCFLNRMKTPVYHDDEIKSESDTAIKIGILNGDKLIESGGLSNVQVEIFALEGDFPHASPESWTAKKFSKHRANARDGNGSVLAGEGKKAQLKNGQCDLGSIKFTEGSCKAHGGKFIIGARVCEGEVSGVRVQEAVMSPVVVQDRRNKSNEKSHPPKLKDGVHRLEGISKDGELYKRLEKEKIITVEDFLKSYNKGPYNLANILKLNMEHKPWKKMTKHAKECSLEGRHKLKSFTRTEKNVKLFFNCVHCLVGAEFIDGQYTASDKFTLPQQVLVDQLKEGAYAGLDSLPEDHVMTDNSPNPIHMDKYTGIGSGPSYMPSEQPSCSVRPTAVQVEGTSAAEGLSRVWVHPSCAHVNNDPVPCSAIPDYHSVHNYQVGGIPVPPFQGLSDAETLYSNANNNDPGLSSSTADHLHTYNYQEQGIQFVGQYRSSAPLNALPHGGTIDTCQFAPNQDAQLAFLCHQADTNSYVTAGSDDVEMQRALFWSLNDTLGGASTSAHINMAALPPEQLVIAGTPRSAHQGSTQSQIMQAPQDPGNGDALAAPASAQPALRPQQWCRRWNGGSF